MNDPNSPLLSNQQSYGPSSTPGSQNMGNQMNQGGYPAPQMQGSQNQSMGSPQMQMRGQMQMGSPQMQNQSMGSPQMQMHGQMPNQSMGSPQMNQGGYPSPQLTGQVHGSQSSAPVMNNDQEFLVVEENVQEKSWELCRPPENFESETVFEVTEFTPVLDVPNFDEWDAKQALESYVRSTTCLRRGYSDDMNINSFDTSNAYVVQVETFTEERRIVEDYRPFRGGYVDGPHNGFPPGPWEIVAAPPGSFINHIHSLPLPHTEEVRFCFRCSGRGMIRCFSCSGRGEERCFNCSGSGEVAAYRTDSNGNQERYYDRCTSCHGRGYRMCYRCNGDGRLICDVCEGERDLVYFSRLDIIWATPTIDEVIKEAFDPEFEKVIPDSKLKKGQGPMVYGLEDYMIQPVYDEINTRVNDRVNDAANDLLESSRDPSRYQHRQRLTIRGLPVYELGYLDGHTQKRFWVYGTDHQVYAPSYPWSIWRILLTIFIILVVVGGVGFCVYWFGIEGNPLPWNTKSLI